MNTKKKPHQAGPGTATNVALNSNNTKQPIVTGQCGEVLSLIYEHQPILSFKLTADHAIPEAAARIHDLRSMGFHVMTTILPTVEFRGRIRRNAAVYSLGNPVWPAPGFLPKAEGSE